MIFYFNSKKLSYSKEKSFTILEVMIAIFVLTLAVGASYILIQKTFIASSLTQSKLVASYLAQEGIENIKNMRDSNWLTGIDWNEGIESTYNEGIITFLDGTQSKFQRQTSVIIEDYLENNNDRMKVTVKVTWNERGKDQTTEAVNYLYDWYSDPPCYFNGEPQNCDGPAATELNCVIGDEGCRRCNNGVCTVYTDGEQHNCLNDWEGCDANGECVGDEPNVCEGILDNTQVPGCDGPCQACQSGICEYYTDYQQHNCDIGYVCDSSGQCSLEEPDICVVEGGSCNTDGECCATAPYCYRDFDNDGYAAVTGAKVCKTSASLGTDCYDLNANAKPGQGNYFLTDRGDGSFDYNCNDVQDNIHDNCVTTWSGPIGCTTIMPTGGINGWVGQVPPCGDNSTIYLRRVCQNYQTTNCSGGSGSMGCPAGCYPYYPSGSWSVVQEGNIGQYCR